MPWTKIYPDRSEFERACNTAGRSLRGITYRDAIKEALLQLMEKDRRVFVMGEGVDDAPGIFGTTKGLDKRFGKKRVIDTPVAENGMTGVAIGAALGGMRPIMVHQRMDFMPLSMDQIINHLSKWKYMFGGKVNIPLTIRSIIGRGWGSGAQHSQNLQALFMHIPGLKVIMPATPYDAKGLLIASVKDENPIIFIEHRWLYGHVGYVPEKMYSVPIGQGIVRRRGKDVTVAGTSLMVFEAIKASEILQKENIDIEVIDLRSLKPFDEELVFKSVRKTGRLVVADTGWKTCGIAAEVIATTSERLFKFLKGPTLRVSLPDAPTPASSVLEKAFYPGAKEIISAVKKVVKSSR